MLAQPGRGTVQAKVRRSVSTGADFPAQSLYYVLRSTGISKPPCDVNSRQHELSYKRFMVPVPSLMLEKLMVAMFFVSS